jgi:hypothetical protein
MGSVTPTQILFFFLLEVFIAEMTTTRGWGNFFLKKFVTNNVHGTSSSEIRCLKQVKLTQDYSW